MDRNKSKATDKYYRIEKSIVKRTEDNLFDRFSENGNWEFAPGLVNVFYDAASNVEEIADPDVITSISS